MFRSFWWFSCVIRWVFHITVVPIVRCLTSRCFAHFGCFTDRGKLQWMFCKLVCLIYSCLQFVWLFLELHFVYWSLRLDIVNVDYFTTVSCSKRFLWRLFSVFVCSLFCVYNFVDFFVFSPFAVWFMCWIFCVLRCMFYQFCWPAFLASFVCLLLHFFCMNWVDYFHCFLGEL